MQDFTNPDWGAISKWANEQLDALRKKNDSVALTPEETAAIRGEIRALKRLLGLPEEAARAKQIKSSFTGA